MAGFGTVVPSWARSSRNRSGERLSWPILSARSASSRNATAMSWSGFIPMLASAWIVPWSVSANALHHRGDPVGAGVGFGALVFVADGDEVLVAAFEGDARLQFGGAQGVAIFEHAALGVDLGVADLPLLEFDGQLGGEFVFLDGALLFDGGVAAGVQGFVGFLEQGLAGSGFERAGAFRRGLDGEDGQGR